MRVNPSEISNVLSARPKILNSGWPYATLFGLYVLSFIGFFVTLFWALILRSREERGPPKGKPRIEGAPGADEADPPPEGTGDLMPEGAGPTTRGAEQPQEPGRPFPTLPSRIKFPPLTLQARFLLWTKRFRATTLS